MLQLFIRALPPNYDILQGQYWMAGVCEGFLSALIDVLFDRLASSDLLYFARREEVHKHLKKWEKVLLNIKAVLEDAEEKQYRDRSVKLWLAELRDLAYDVDDLLDEFATEALSKKLDAGSPNPSMVRKLVSSLNTKFSPSAVRFNVKMGSKIKEITARFQEIISQKECLELRERGAGGSTSDRVVRRLPSTSLVNESSVYGREKDKNTILELLLKNEEPGAGVISIVGMGGIGKTTLAQLVYNDVSVEGFFDLKAWVCVSEEFDVVRVTKTILQSVSFEFCDLNDLNLLQVKLSQLLMRKRFLIVLDDIWNEKYEDLMILFSPFQGGYSGSKVIVTTRSQTVASMVGTVPAYHLNEMSFASCLSLLTQHALGRKNFDDHPNLKVVGEEIVKRCKGLPLAAKTLGGLLCRKADYHEWESILNSKLWDLPEEKSGILPALWLSYQHLPSHLKQCFAFCAIFPKDYEFDKDELVQLWIGEGFISQTKGMKQIEDLAAEYFWDLLSRSFFQQSSSNDSFYVMHDLINDLAQSVAAEVCVQLEDKMGFGQHNFFERVCHSSYIRHKYDVCKRFDLFYTMRRLRTFLALPLSVSDLGADSYLSTTVLQELLPKLKRLRVLSLSGYCISELPDSIGYLKHLRYLNFSHTKIKCLPQSVSVLYNLQTLNLSGCKKLIELPRGIENLVNLHYLDIVDTDDLKVMPLKIGNLVNLKKLPKFIVGKGNGPRIGELGSLSKLRGLLFIFELQHVTDIQDARLANLKEKHGLDELVMKWSNDSNDSSIREDQMSILEMLEPNRNLKKLKISGYSGAEFPSWIVDPSFDNMVYLSLCDCQNISSLPSLGSLPFLKELHIEGLSGVKHVGPEFFGANSFSDKLFPSLKILRFGNMLEWEEWSSPTQFEVAEGKFPCLHELSVWKCPRLVRDIPSHLTSLVKLHIFECPRLEGSLVSLPSLCELHLEQCDYLFLTRVVDLTSLTTLKIERISNLSCLHKNFIDCLVLLEILEIEDCVELVSLWQKGANLEKLSCLKRLVIGSCPQLVQLTDGEQELPCNLEYMEIYDCANLEKLPNDLHKLRSLKDLSIKWCPKLLSFPRTGLPSKIKSLAICGCTNLGSLPKGLMHDDKCSIHKGHLECLEIVECPSLRSFPEGELSGALKKLEIWDCMELESLSERLLQNSSLLEFIVIGNYNLQAFPECLYRFKYLTGLHVIGCPCLVCFPESGLPIPNFRRFYIYNCERLQSLPNYLHNLTSLQYLTIFGCPGLTSFPDGGFPPNLLSLTIGNCRKITLSFPKWGLYKLTSLKDLNVGDCNLNVTSFPEDSTLPLTLVHLRIHHLEHLKFLSKGLQNLTSLEALDVWDCPQLQSLPKDGLPVMLGVLDIRNCPLLGKHDFKERGVCWPIVSHIPCVKIDYVEIH
ncbi:putative disease resistance RPP13-like protein 1 isoform X1 [Herrania umbratica]|uniref:Disease resistance RPP13-like protein 1 isoform X1 n=1 Tax=Herrania umbratica TaxID=108875 RepID=A0A6J1A3B1_9ROSI|nr:putative disease resistance RPP13-like protein 1 isoform X1 [Herrania umbratica]